jgi:hypothetical protein
MAKSAYRIVLSNYMRELIPGTKVVYHGSDPCFKTGIVRIEARKKMHLPEKGKIALAQGFITNTKGWGCNKKIKNGNGLEVGGKLFKELLNKKINFEYYDNKVINLNIRYHLKENSLYCSFLVM